SRWQQLVARGHRDELASYCIQSNTAPAGVKIHIYNTESASTGSFYRQTLLHHPDGTVEGECTCPASECHQLCKHLALCLDQLGMLSSPRIDAPLKQQVAA